MELRDRIGKFCQGKPYEEASKKLNISTMHSLALKVLRRGNLLSHYPRAARQSCWMIGSKNEFTTKN